MNRILVINNDLGIGGIQKSLIDFLSYLVSQGHEIDLLVWQKDGLLREQIPTSVNVIERECVKTWLNITEEKNFRKKNKFLIEYLKFNFYARIIKKPWLYFPRMEKHYQTALAYCQNGYPRFYAIDSVSADKKYLWYHHGSYESTGDIYELDRKYYGKFDKLVTVSSSNKKMLIEHFEEYSDKFFIVPNIINVEKIIFDSQEPVADFSKTEGIFNFVTVSRFSKEKGIDLAIKIAAELKNQGLQFKWYFVGDGDTFLEIKNLIKEGNLTNECILLGTKENPYPYMKLADLYIQTSYVESQSITIYEALVLKNIIVTTNLPALNEALRNGKFGILCKPEIDCFVQEIKNILNNVSLRNKLAARVDEHLVINDSAYKAIDELFGN